MKTITLSLDDETYRRAEAKASVVGISIAEMLQILLTSQNQSQDEAVSDREFKRLAALQREVRDRVIRFSATDRLPREQLYDRSNRLLKNPLVFCSNSDSILLSGLAMD